MSNKKVIKASTSTIPKLFICWIVILVFKEGPEEGMGELEIQKALPEEFQNTRDLGRKLGQVLKEMISQGFIELKGDKKRMFKLTDSGRKEAEGIKQYMNI